MSLSRARGAGRSSSSSATPTAVGVSTRLLVAVLLLLAAPRPATSQTPQAVEPAPGRPLIDEGACQRLPIVPPPRSGELPSRQEAQFYPVDGVRRILNQGATDKTLRVKQIVANQRPVLFTLADPQAGTLIGDLWVTGNDGANTGTSNRRTACSNAMVVVAYDDSSYGGAFEILRDCGTTTYRESSFWMRYEDFDALSVCAVELVGDGAANHR